jgi:putative SOS response-associated peptidase YedK
MCNRYLPTIREKLVGLGFLLPPAVGWAAAIGPRQPGPYLLPDRRVVVGQWGLIPPFATERHPRARDGRPLMTNNARLEGIEGKPTFRDAWRRGRRCIVPADAFIEPYWGTGRNTWWSFARADGRPWMLAGLWNDWTDPESGEIVPSYTMITINADTHPLMRLMHRPDPKLPVDAQDKRSVVPLADEAVQTWLTGSTEEARAVLVLPPVEAYRHGPEDPEQRVELPV